MRIHDVNLPQAVIDAQKRGGLVLFASAGVSMDAPSNYPNFLDLATELGGTVYPKQKDELIDRYLGRLVERGIPVHERVKTRLELGHSLSSSARLCAVRGRLETTCTNTVHSAASGVNADDKFGQMLREARGNHCVRRSRTPGLEESATPVRA